MRKLWNKRLVDYTMGDYTKVSLVTLVVTLAPLFVWSWWENRKFVKDMSDLADEE
jgi:hypothetical protein